MHESLARFGESFAAFLYGLNMNAFVVDFPEAPVVESVRRWQKREARKGAGEGDTTIMGRGAGVGDETTLGTGDTSFASMKATPRRKSMLPSAPKETPGTVSTTASSAASGRTGIPAARGRGMRGGGRGGAASGLPRGRGRGVR